MKVLLSAEQWAALNVDSEYDFVRSAFYLGLGIIYIQSKARHGVWEDERIEVVKTAIAMGITDADVVLKG